MRDEIVKSRLGGVMMVLALWCSGSLAAWAAGPSAGPAMQSTEQGQQSPSKSKSQRKHAAGQKTSAAHAPSEAQLQAVVITGYAASLANAISLKSHAIDITDSISAVGIGEFAEQNLAEALQRITGVQITRNQGEGQFISVEGMDPKFTDILYDGRPLPSGSGTRAFDFQVLSGNFANNVVVYKSPTADLPSSGLAATINVESIDPLSYGKRSLVLSAQGLYNEQARKGVTPNIEGLYTDTFFDDRLGWIVAVDLNERNVDSQMASTDGVLSDRLFNVGLGDQVGFDKRLSAMSKVEFKVNSNLELSFDTLDSEYANTYDWYLGDDFYPGAYALGPESTLSQTVGPDNVQTAWAGTNVFGYGEANYYSYTQRLTSNALTAKAAIGKWRIDAQGSFAEAREEATNMYVDFESRAPGATLYYNAATTPVSFGFVGYNPNDVSNYSYVGEQGSYDEPTTDTMWIAKVDASRPLDSSWLSMFQTGFNYEDEIFGIRPNGIGLTSAGFASDMSPYLMMDNNPTFFSSYRGSAQFPTNFLTVNLNKFYAAYPLSQFVAANPPVTELSQTYRVEEKSETAYGQVLFNTPDERLTGNLGLRVVRTEELSSGYVPAPGATLRYGYGGVDDLLYSSQGIFAYTNSYTNILPDLNIKYEITPDLVARFAAAQLLERPDINLLGESSAANASTGPPVSGTGWVGTLTEGNPKLKPYHSNQLDMSLEWYFAPRSLLSGMVFYKHVMDMIVTNYYSEQAQVSIGTGTIPITLQVAQPGNAEKTNIPGVEVGWEQPFVFLPGFLRYFGAEANYTHIWTEKVLQEEGQAPLPVTGVSSNTYNAGVYYDTGRYGVHVNYNYRSQWVADPLSYFGDGIYVKGYGQLDLAGDYNVNRWLTVTGSITNVTQSASQQTDEYGINRLYELDGRLFWLGVHVKL